MIARKSVLIMIATFLLILFGWIELILVVKFWGEFAREALGVMGYAMSFIALCNVMGGLGFGAAHVKRVSEGKDLGTCIGTFATIKIFLTCLMATVTLIIIFILDSSSNGEFFNATTIPMLYIFLIFNIFSNLLSIPIATFTAQRKMAKREAPYIIGRMIGLPFFFVIVMAGASSASISPAFVWPTSLQPLQQFLADHAVEFLASTYIISTITSIFAGIWYLRKYPLKKPSWELFKSYFSFALPIMFLPIISIITVSIDKLMIGYFWSSSEVGDYVTMAGVLGVVIVFPRSIADVLFPSISEYYSKENIVKIRQAMRSAERYISMIVVPIVIGLMILAKPFVRIVLSDVFLHASSVLVVLAIFTLIVSLNMPYRSLMTGMNKPIFLTIIVTATCIANITLNYMFIPKNGLLSSFGINGPTGAACATVLSVLIAFFGLRIIAKKMTGINLLQSHTPRHIIAGIVGGFVLYFLAYQTPLFPVIDWYHLILFFIIGFAIYIGLLYLLKEFNKKDFDFFIDIIRPKEMVKYVSSELKEKPEKPNK